MKQAALVLLFQIAFSGIINAQEKQTLHIKKKDSLACHINLDEFTFRDADTLWDANFSLHFSTGLLEIKTKENTISTWKIYDYEISVQAPGDSIPGLPIKTGAAETFPVLCKLMNEVKKGTNIILDKVRIINNGSNVILEDNVKPLIILKSR